MQQTRKTAFPALIVFLTLSACSSLTATSVVDKIKSKSQSTAATDYRSAINKGSPFSLKNGQLAESELIASDEVLDINGNISNYKLFSIQPASDATYRITVNSYCSCFGFDKKLMIPSVSFLTRSGKELENKLENSELIQGTSLHLKSVWKVASTEERIFYILIASDNRKPGHVVDQLNFSVYTNGNGSGNAISGVTQVKSFPHGKFDIEYTAIQ